MVCEVFEINNRSGRAVLTYNVGPIRVLGHHVQCIQ